HRVLGAQSGPVNWEIAHQIGRAVAGAGSPGPRPTADEIRAIEEACRIAQLRITERTGMEPAGLTKVDVVDRVTWTVANLDGFRPLVDRLSVRLRGQMGLQGGEEIPGLPINMVLDALGPFLLGIQMGFLVGFLSRTSLAHYDLCLPRQETGHLSFTHPNIIEVERDLEADPRQFRQWLALHEVAHQLMLQAHPWVLTHLRGLIERYVDGAEVDTSEVMDRLQGLADPEQLSRIMEHPEELLPLLTTPAQERMGAEIQAVMGAIEGYADWVVAEAGTAMLPQLEKIREGVARRRVERTAAERLLEGLLGLDLKPEHYRAGVRFVQAVAGAEKLDDLWQGPGQLPTLDELREPSKWLARVSFG
ncbi:MAG: zinc-dependent metalloprotease, partial [Actinomycetota bacterium]